MLLKKENNIKLVLALIPSSILTYLNLKLVRMTMNRSVINLTLNDKTKNLVEAYPTFIKMVKAIYSPVIFISLFILFLMIINFLNIHKPEKEKKVKPKLYPNKIPYNQHDETLNIHIGAIHNERDLEITDNPKLCTITEKNLLKNIVIFGVIGEGKTASNHYVYLQQAIYYQADNPKKKVGGLITDVKGNFAQKAVEFCKDVGRDDDIILFRICGDFFINFLYKPEEPAMILASRFTEFLKSHNSSGNEDYWIDNAQKVIAFGIILARLINEDEYFTFEDLDRTIVDIDERQLIIDELTKRYEEGKMTKYERDLFLTAKRFFEQKYEVLGERMKGIIVSEVDRVIGAFTSDPIVKYTFCPPKDKLNFPSFRKIIEEGKIFIMDIPDERFKIVARIANTFSKLEYQSVIKMRMSNKEYNQDRICFFESDENHKIVTPEDADFLSLAREAKNFSIVATQSVSSYLTVLKNKNLVNSMLNNLDNKIFMRNTDVETLDYCLKILGKEIKTYSNRSTSESGKSDIDYVAANVAQDNKSISQTHSEVDRKEEVFTQEFFSRTLDEFQAVGLVNSGKVLAPIHLFKYWENRVTNGHKLKKATVKNEFIYASYPTTKEMIDKINGEDEFVNDNKGTIKNKAEDTAQQDNQGGEVQGSMMILSEKEKIALDKYMNDNKEKSETDDSKNESKNKQAVQQQEKIALEKRATEKSSKEHDVNKEEDLLDAFKVIDRL